MKIGILGDVHFTNKPPKRRLDDYWETQKRKFRQSLSIFKDNKCDIVLQVGDLFESPTAPNSVVSEVIQILLKYETKLHLAWGNHDVYGCTRGTLPNSPLSILESSEVINILGDEPLDCGDVLIYGAGFGDPIPKCRSDEPLNVLVAHKMIGDENLHPGDDVIKPNSFLRSNPLYGLIIAGHYHYKFSSQYKERSIINPGAMIRKTVAKRDMESRPSVVVYEVGKNSWETFELDHEPPDAVFDTSSTKSGEYEVDFDGLVKKIKGSSGGQKVRWKSTVIKVMEERKCSESVVNEIETAIEEVGE